MPRKLRVVQLNGVIWTREEMAQFKKAYEKAVAENQKFFVIEDRQIRVEYAKYLILHAEAMMGPLTNE